MFMKCFQALIISEMLVLNSFNNNKKLLNIKIYIIIYIYKIKIYESSWISLKFKNTNYVFELIKKTPSHSFLKKSNSKLFSFNSCRKQN